MLNQKKTKPVASAVLSLAASFCVKCFAVGTRSNSARRYRYTNADGYFFEFEFDTSGRPFYRYSDATDHHPFSETYNVPNITRVVVHGPQRDFAIDLLAGGGSGPGGTALAMLFRFRSLLTDYSKIFSAI